MDKEITMVELEEQIEKTILGIVEDIYNTLLITGNKPVYGKRFLNYYNKWDIVKENYDYNENEKEWINRIIKKGDKRNIYTFNFENGTHKICKKYALYLVGSTFFNPHTKEEFYWIKVGKSTDLEQRMKGYATHNPMLWKQSFYYCEDKVEMDRREHYCHKILEKVALDNKTEWFQVSRETYLEICDTEWNFFNK